MKNPRKKLTGRKKEKEKAYPRSFHLCAPPDSQLLAGKRNTKGRKTMRIENAKKRKQEHVLVRKREEGR